ncbi:hypothetical protein BDZ45DRAFT_795139 [Acephala macrosclerotiorum]|nr:hypothetical protein BDZ45DRAFT_795139 [Acephala macrosclerotiorum]
MWQLELLSRVIPAFGALAKEFTECYDNDARLQQHAQDCYSDIVAIGWAVSVSCGEWASGMNDEDITGLLTALESRFPTRWMISSVFTTSLPHKTTAVGPSERKQFPMLNHLTNSIESIGLGGFDECSELPTQPRERRGQYLGIMGPNVSLFHKKEKWDLHKRKKFLDRVKGAAKHLLDVYCKEDSGLDAEDFSLSQHPSHGMKELANRAYNLLEQHWRCSCAQRAAMPAGAREARLSLIRHCQLAPKMPSHASTRRGHLPAKFEVLLPVCNDSVEWKVTNVEVKNTSSHKGARIDREPVNNDICRTLLQSKTLQVDFLAENSGFWHLKPELPKGSNRHATMESLHQLLGDGFSISHISKYTPREQLILCYILANSMLYLYPGSWFQTAWSSNKVYFIPRANSSTSSILTFPYLSVELQQPRNVPNDPPHMQYHTHPVILALGITFLEIATGVRFKRSREPTPWEQFNTDGTQAWTLLNDLERQSRSGRSERISPALRKAIRACVKLEPPPDFPSNNLSEEGPIRHYILSCIVHPLASELKYGHKVRLEDLHDDLVSEKDKENLDDPDNQRSTSRRPSSPTGNFAHAKISIDAESTLAERRELCLFGDREEPINNEKKAAASKWFEWHGDALCHIAERRISSVSDAQRVKIAILDSGIELSQDHKDMYDTEPKIKHRSWVGSDTEWRDEVGHGTHLAILLRKVAPNAVLHVARVFKRKPDIQKSAKIIAEAICHAVDVWKVDIIVMSFGFGAEHESLYKSIKGAAYKGVVIFAAASNDGKNRPGGIAWPAKQAEVICVHSGDGYGTPSSFTPSPQDSQRIMALGECVKSAWPQSLKSPGDQKLMSGTSCAAPIAAGIAAVILDYARGFLTQEEWEKLRRVDSMRRMFERMKDSNPHTGYWWIKHWEWFDPKRTEGWIHGEIRGIL